MEHTKIEDHLVVEGDQRFPDVVYRYRAGKIVDHTIEGTEIFFLDENNIVLRIRILTPDIFRLSYSLEGEFVHDFSYAIDPEFTPEEISFDFEEGKDRYRIKTDTLTCEIKKEKMLVDFYEADGDMLCKDKRGFYRRESLQKGISEISITKESPEEAQYFGLGDKPFELNLRGKTFENWNTDSFGYERGDDPIYRSVPFYMGLVGGRGYGIFFDNSYRTTFDFDSRENGTSSFSAAGGALNYYFINGPELTDVARKYTRLTGTPELPPLWALGYHQCRWSYFPESRVKEVAETFRKKEIPCDAIYLDIDYMEDYKVFTWNKEHFPNPKKMLKDLADIGFRTIVMIDPGIRIDHDYPPFEEGKAGDFFCKRPDGDLVIGPVWPPRCVFPDYTKPEVREWWADKYDGFMKDLKVSGIWNDMNEPAVFEVDTKTFPEDIRHDHDGHPCSHKKAHNIYGMQMARASLQGMKKHNPDKRPFLLTRANFAGGQRFAALWTGDNIATWDHLKLANEQCQRLSISGFSFCGSDIGGFVETPTPELYVRWVQLGIFHPLFRTHSMGYNVDGAAAVQKEAKESVKETGDQEPWSFGKEATDIAREIIGLRYRLLNYLYTAYNDYVENGTPVLKPLVYHDQHDLNTLEAKDEFMFGDRILVSPVLEKKRKSKKVYLPNDGQWYHFWDDRKLDGGEKHTIETPLEQIPFFIRAGTVLPMRELMQYADQKEPDHLELLVYHGSENETSHLYEDAEEGYEYKEGEYLSTTFEYKPDDQKIKLNTAREGNYKPVYDNVKIVFIGLPITPSKCTVDDVEKELEQVDRNGKIAWKLDVSPDFEEIVISG